MISTYGTCDIIHVACHSLINWSLMMSMNKTSGFTRGVSNNAIGFIHGFSVSPANQFMTVRVKPSDKCYYTIIAIY
jgi:hypothetical protein